MLDAVQRSGLTFSRARTRDRVASTISTPISLGKGWPERISEFSATVSPLFLAPSRRDISGHGEQNGHAQSRRRPASRPDREKRAHGRTGLLGEAVARGGPHSFRRGTGGGVFLRR